MFKKRTIDVIFIILFIICMFAGTKQIEQSDSGAIPSVVLASVESNQANSPSLNQNSETDLTEKELTALTEVVGTPVKVLKQRMNRATTLRCDNVSDCFYGSVRNLTATLELSVHLYTKICALESRHRIAELYEIASAVGFAEGYNSTQKTLSPKVLEEINTLTTYKGLKFSGYLNELHSSFRDNNVRQKIVDRLWLALSDELDDIIKKTNLPFYLRRNIWHLLQNIRMVNILKTTFGDNVDACIPTTWRFIREIWELTNTPNNVRIVKPATLNPVSYNFDVVPENFINGGVVYTFWGNENLATMKSSEVLFSGYLSNKLGFEYTLVKGDGEVNHVYRYLDQVINFKSGTKCSTLFFVTFAVQKSCEKYMVYLSIRFLSSNRRLFDYREFFADEIEYTSFKFNNAITFNNHLFTNTKYKAQLELFFMSYTSDANLVKALSDRAVCNNQNGQCKYSNLNDCVVCNKPFATYNGKCVNNCPNGTYKSSTGNCAPCAPQCQTCSGPNNGNCITCANNLLMNTGSCVTTCPDNMAPNKNRQCVKCDENCLVCKDATTCSKCSATHFLKDGKCVPHCGLTFYASYSPNKCNPCPTGCAECVGPKKCVSCDPGFFLKDGLCVRNCGERFFANTVNKTCTPCTYGCQTCNNSKTCLTCIPGLVFYKKTQLCKEQCPEGQAKVNGVCVKCTDPNCLRCSAKNINQCITCNNSTYNKNGKCVTNCGEGFYLDSRRNCRPCSKNCKTCNKDKCLQCFNKLLVFRDLICLKNCPNGYVKSGNVCVKCDDPLTCRRCKPQELSTCTDCYKDKVFFAGKCLTQCPPEYYNNNGKCVPCLKGCEKCQNGFKCERCLNNWFLKNHVCEDCCGVGYAESNRECKKCTVPDCNVCNANSLGRCEKCIDKRFLYNNQCLKVCPLGTYPNPNGTCEKCQEGCALCNNKDTCIRCVIGKVLQGTQCQSGCNDGYVNINGVCTKCANPRCKKCQIDNLGICTECPVGTFLYKGDCLKVCPDGTFAEKGTCKACVLPCVECLNRDTCTKCVSGFFIIKGKCTDQCPDRQVNQNGNCVPCADIYCKKCSVGDVTTCLVCDPGFVRHQGKCLRKCHKGFYEVDGVCHSCIKGCAKCNNSQTCIKCNQPFSIFNGYCVTPCPAGTVQVNDKCVTCNPTCKTCSPRDHNLCVTCPNPYKLFNGKCLTQCPEATYTNEYNQCKPCGIDKCTKCTGGSSCTKCQNGFVLLNNKCIPEPCPVGYVVNPITNSCTACEVNNCSKCPLNDLKSCKTCVAPLLLLNNNLCVPNCPSGFYKDASTQTCQPCSSNCKSCSDNSTCLVCINNYYLLNQKCRPDCPSGYAQNDGKCIPCNTKNCSACSPNGKTCTECNNPLVLNSNNQCVKECPEGFWSLLRKCVQCPNGCQDCCDGSRCDHCLPGKTLTPNGQCIDDCPTNNVSSEGKCVKCQTDKNCLKCNEKNLKECVICNSGFALKNNQCVPNCGSGFVNLSGKCQPCPGKCSVCSHPSRCEVCDDRYFIVNSKCEPTCPTGFQPVNGTCSRCEPKCLKCNTNKCFVCENGSFLHNGKCVQVCPKGTYENAGVCNNCNKQCLQCISANTCTVCQNGFLLKNGNCLPDCGNGSVQINGKCVACEKNCRQCNPLNTKECTDCAKGFFLHRGVCVPKCPLGFFGNNGACQPCLNGCEVCSNATLCEKCKNPLLLSSDKKSCKPDCVIGNKELVNRCTPCRVPGCKTCSVSPNICEVCNLPKALLDNTCVDNCPAKKYYRSKSGNTCKKCPPGCYTCTHERCISCLSGYRLDVKSCVNKCPDGQIKVAGKCQECLNPNCSHCDSSKKQCIVCRPPYVLEVENGVTNCVSCCKEGFFNNQGTCKQCVPNCKTCYNDRECAVCHDGFVSQKGQCVVRCDKGYVQNNLVCEKCIDPNCLRCNPQNRGTCSRCEQGYYLKGDKCVSNCGNGFYPLNIPTGLSRCLPCDKNCNICTGHLNCQVCSNGFYVRNGQCVPKCNTGFTLNVSNNTCVECVSKQCVKCDVNNRATCLTCLPGYYIQEGQCVQRCSPGYRVNGINCQPCNDNKCVSCNSGVNKCERCQVPFNVLGGDCVKDCPVGMVARNGVCRKCDDPNCNLCHPERTDKCSICKDGFLNDIHRKCIHECPLGTYTYKNNKCLPCPNNCKKCADAKTCLECNIGFIFNKKRKCTDSCAIGTVKVNGKCVPCKDPNCKKCSPNNVGLCGTCKAPFLTYKERCYKTCPDGTFQIGDTCKKCLPNCNKCKNELTCEQCFPIFVRNGKWCVRRCDDGYRPVNGKCVKCPNFAAVKRCPNPPKPIVCRDNVFRLNNTCVNSCPKGYHAEADRVCHPCPKFCVECKSSKTCEKCDSTHVLHNNQCLPKCPTNFVNLLGVCIRCTSFKCKQCRPQNPRYCEDCTKPLLNYSGKCVKYCPTGTYKEGNKCLKCDQSCLECTSKDKCTKCQPQFENRKNKCYAKCQPGEVLVKNTCIACQDSNCKSCSSLNINLCTHCNPGFKNIFDKCVKDCPVGFFLNPKNNTCQPCSKHCRTCTENQCTQCLDGFYPFAKSPKHCVPCRGDRYVVEKGQCTKCKPGHCLKCVTGNSNVCEICHVSTFLVNGQCVNSCPPGTYRYRNTCKPCTSNCAKCTSNDYCDVCHAPFVRHSGVCTNKCPAGYVINPVSKQCVRCPEKCIECSKDSKTCTKCDPPTILYNKSCHTSCPEGTTIQNGTCKPCSPGCISCTANSCIKCAPGLIPRGKKCVKVCGPGFYQTKSQCVRCTDPNCQVCSPENKCKTCKANQFRNYNGLCVPDCKNGTYKDLAKRKCRLCDKNCETCTGPKQCTKCITGLILNKGLCIATCPDGYAPSAGKCAPCADKNCNLCPLDVKTCNECNSKSKFTLLSGKCVPVCPKGYYTVKGRCKKCNPKCLECKDYKTCTHCRPEFELVKGNCNSPCTQGQVLINDKCVSCADKNCRFCTSNVNICVDCNSPFVLYDGTCRTTCPNNYFVDSNRRCSKCDNGCESCKGKNICTKCADGLYLINDRCVKTCPIRYWGECKERVCKKCNEACVVCADSTSTNCRECSKGFYLDGTSCLKEDNCSNGTFPNPVTRKCSPCPIKFCATCINYNTCGKCVSGYTVNSKGGCTEAKSFINIIPEQPRLVSQITRKILGKTELMNYSQNLKSLGVGSQTVTYSFFLRRITEFTTQTSILRTSSTLPSAIFSFYINNDVCYVRVNLNDYRVGDCSYNNLYTWKFFSVVLEKNGVNANINIYTQSNNELVQKTFTFALPSSLFWVNLHSLFYLNTPTKSNAVELSNLNLFDYAPNRNETLQFFGNKPSQCDYACVECGEKCFKCPGNTLPGANGLCNPTYIPVFVDLEVFVNPRLIPLRRVLTKRLDSFDYGLLLWFYSTNNKTDYTVGSLFYPYSPKVNLITVRSANNQLQVLVNKQVFTLPNVSQNEWHQVGVFVTNGSVRITFQKRLGSPSTVTQSLNNKIRLLTEDASFGNPLFKGSLFDVRVYVNGLPNQNEIDEHFRRNRCGENCLVCSKSMRCTRCAPKFSLSKNFKCFSTDLGNTYQVLDKYSFFNKEVYTIDVPQPLLQKPFSLSFWYRKKIHSVPDVPPQNYFNVLSYVPIGAPNTLFPLVQEKIYPVNSYNSDFLIGGDCGATRTFTENFSNEVYSWIHFVLNFYPQQKLVSFYVKNDNKVTFTGNYTYHANKFVFGDRNGSDMNFEIGNAFIYEKPVTVDNLANVQTYEPKDCDPACLKCNYFTGQCNQCAIQTLGIVNKCKNLLKGYVSAYTYNRQVVEPTTSKLFSVDLRSVFNRDVNSLEYSVIGYFRLFDHSAFKKWKNHKFSLFTLNNRNDEKRSPSNYLMSLQLESCQEGLKLLWVTNDHNHVVETEVNNVNLAPNQWVFIYATVNVVQKRLNYVFLVEKQGEKPLFGTVQFKNYPEKLQERARLNLFGLAANLPDYYKTVNGQFLHFYLSPNFGWNPNIIEKFRKAYPLPKDPKCSFECKRCIHDFSRELDVCLKCKAGFTLKNGKCTKIVNSDYIIFSDQFNTNLLPTKTDFTLPVSATTIEKNTLAFYFRRNFIPRDMGGNRVILRAGQLTVSLTVSQGTSASLNFDIAGVSENISFSVVDSQLDDDYFWNLVLILYTPHSIRVLVKNESGTQLGNKQISFSNVKLRVPSLSFNSLNNEVSIYGPHLLLNYFYLEPLFKFPQLDCSIDCNVCVADKCEDCPYGFTSNNRCLNRPIKSQAFVVSQASVNNNRIHIRDYIGDNRYLRSNTWTLSFTFESSVDISNFTGRSLVRLQNTQTTQYNQNLINDNLFSVKFHENRSFFLSANTRHYQSKIKSAEGWTSRSLKPNLTNNKFFVVITVDDDNDQIHLFVYNNEQNVISQTFKYEGVLDNLVNSGTLIFGEGFGLGRDTTKIVFDNVRFYYENALTSSYFTQHYRRLMRPFQDTCNSSTRTSCSLCNKGVLVKSENTQVCSPNPSAYTWNLNHVRNFNERFQNYTVPAQINNPQQLDSLTFSFWYRRTSYSNQPHKLVSVGGVVLIHYENNALFVNVEGFDCALAGTIRIPNIYGKTNGLHWIHITVSLNLKNKTFEVYTHNTADQSNRYAKSNVNVQTWGNLRNFNLTWNLDHTGCPFTTYSFEVSNFFYVPNFVPTDSYDVELYRTKRPSNCESTCLGQCDSDNICPHNLRINSQLSLPNQGYNPKAPGPLYRSVSNFFNNSTLSYPLFREYLIGFDLNIKLLQGSTYAANKNNLINMINDVVNCTHDMNRVVTDLHFKYGIFSVELRPETLRFFLGGSEVNDYASYFDFNFKELKNVDTVRVAFYINSDRNFGKIILHLDDLTASYKVTTVYPPQPITRDTMVFTNPAVSNFRINVHNPRFTYDFDENILTKGYGVLHSSNLCRSRNNCDKCSILPQSPTVYCQGCSKGYKMINNMCLKESSFHK